MKKIKYMIIIFLIIASCMSVAMADTIPFEVKSIEKDYGVIQRANTINEITIKVITVIQFCCFGLFVFSIIRCVWNLIKKEFNNSIKSAVLGLVCVVVFFWVGIFNIIEKQA